MLDGIDAELDAIGVSVRKVVMCGECMKEMESIARNSFRCGKCGITHSG